MGVIGIAVKKPIPVDGIDVYTKLMLHMDDVALIDSSDSAHATTLRGGTARSAVQSKFGGYSAYFDGSGDWLTAEAHVDWNFSSDFTIDFWLYNETGNNKTLLKSVSSENWNTASTNDWLLALGGDSKLSFYVKDVGAAGGNGIALLDDTWYHIAIVRSGSVTTLYRNGTSDGNTLNSSATFGNTKQLQIAGLVQTNLTAGSLDGYIDEFRISNGIARWTSDFTPSNVPYF